MANITATIGGGGVHHDPIFVSKVVGADGKVEWEVECKYNSHDVHLLPNGNVLVASMNTREVADAVVRETFDAVDRALLRAARVEICGGVAKPALARSLRIRPVSK